MFSDHLLTNCLLLPSSGDSLLRWQNDKEILLFDLPPLGIESGTVFLLIRGSWIEWAFQFWFGLVWWDLCVAVVDSKLKIISKSKLQCLNKNKQNVTSSLSVQCWILEDPNYCVPMYGGTSLEFQLLGSLTNQRFQIPTCLTNITSLRPAWTI